MVRVVSVGVFFFEGSTVQLHSKYTSACKNTEESEICRLKLVIKRAWIYRVWKRKSATNATIKLDKREKQTIIK